jgi:hypothetical protein
MRGAQPDDRRRASGELQLESRQLADAQRRLSDNPGAAAGGGDQAARSRRRAAEQQRCRTRRPPRRCVAACRGCAGRRASTER